MMPSLQRLQETLQLARRNDGRKMTALPAVKRCVRRFSFVFFFARTPESALLEWGVAFPGAVSRWCCWGNGHTATLFRTILHKTTTQMNAQRLIPGCCCCCFDWSSAPFFPVCVCKDDDVFLCCFFFWIVPNCCNADWDRSYDGDGSRDFRSLQTNQNENIRYQAHTRC